MNRLSQSTILTVCLSAATIWIALPAFAQTARRPMPRSQVQSRLLESRLLDGVTAHRDLAYVPGGDGRQRLDLYVPDASEMLPLLLWIHGGGWQGGSKDGCPPLRAGYPQQGYAVASIGYRLTGQAPFPAQIEDCKAAIRWLRAHADEYHLDPDRVGVWGSSAGGHLAALIGTSGGFEAFDVGENLDQSSGVQAVCDFYGPTDFNVFVTTPRYEGHAAAGSPESKLIGGLVLENPEKVRRVNPITYVDENDPPFLIVHGRQDATVPLNQSKLLFETLKKAEVSAHFHTIDGAGHGGIGFHDPSVSEMVRNFFDEYLKRDGNTVGEPAATTSESTVSNTSSSQQSPDREPRRPGISWRKVVASQDRDRDGRISEKEFRGGPALWKRLDQNDDGFITKSEHDSEMPTQRGSRE
ncbi:alpha/beta hydrolase [Allorhodopirellula heiligendammensis]|nr:alpha/beta hydrolase [Allorhodopirellula heiligendammensis]